MRKAIALLVAAGLALVACEGFAAPYAIGTCLRVYALITLDWQGEVREYVPCIITKPDGINFDPGMGVQSGGNAYSGTWVGNLPANETGSVYLSAGDLAGNFRGVVRPAKPIIDGAAYFGSLFAEPLFQYQQAAINRNQSVDDNLSIVRGSAVKTRDELKTAAAARSNGAQQVAAQQVDQVARNSEANKKQAEGAQEAAASIKQQLAQLPTQSSPIDLASLDRRKVMPPEIAKSVSAAVDPKSLVGSVSLADGSTVNQTKGLVNAIDLELGEYDRIDTALQNKEAFKEGSEALRQARFFAASNSKLAAALYAEGRNARAFLLNEVPVREVAAWNNDKKKFEMIRIDDAVNRALPWASFFGDKSTALRKDISDAAGGLKFKPDESTLRVTEQIVEDAESRLESDPVVSLGGLFRARTLLENAKLYGGIWSKLNKWSKGAASRLREAFAPPETLKDPGGVGKYIATDISKRLKESFATYRSALEAGDYALLGSDKVNDVFGSALLGEMKDSLKNASDAARDEVKPLANLDEVAPTVAHWVSNDARIANAQYTKTEIAELTKLRELYVSRVGQLKIYSERLEVLSRLTALYSSELSKPGWAIAASMKCLSTVCAAEIISISEQLADISGLSRGAGSEVAAAIKRYDEELRKLDQLIDAWLLVQPDPANPGAVMFRRQMQEMSNQLR
jgi:hypothetical protein